MENIRVLLPRMERMNWYIELESGQRVVLLEGSQIDVVVIAKREACKYHTTVKLYLNTFEAIAKGLITKDDFVEMNRQIALSKKHDKE